MRLILSICVILMPLIQHGHSSVWQQTSTRHFTFYYESADQELVNRLKDVGEASVKRISAALDHQVAEKTTVYVISSAAVFDSLLAGQVPDWGVGFAWARQNKIVLKSPRLVHYLLPIERTFRHEYAHIVIGQKLEPQNVPVWFNEGLAMYLSGELLPRDSFILTRAVLTGTLLDFADLENSFPWQDDPAQLAYVQSQVAILYLVRQIHETGIQRLLNRFDRVDNFDYALFSETGMETPLFYRHVSDKIKSEYGWLSLLHYTPLWWGLISVIFFFALIIKYWQTRQKLKKMEDSEALADLEYGQTVFSQPNTSLPLEIIPDFPAELGTEPEAKTT